MITTELVFVRHGEARCNVDGRVGGPATCTGLTHLGYLQVQKAASQLAAEHRAHPFTALCSKPPTAFAAERADHRASPRPGAPR